MERCGQKPLAHCTVSVRPSLLLGLRASVAAAVRACIWGGMSTCCSYCQTVF